MRLTIGVLIVLAALLTFGAINASPAYCVWCPSYTCYARCSKDCACVTYGGQTGGRCVGIQLVDDLPEGAEVLP